MIKQIWVIPVKFFGFEIFHNNVGKIYPSLRSAYEAILYTRSKSLNETEETEFSINDGETWTSTGTLKMSYDEYINYKNLRA